MYTDIVIPPYANPNGLTLAVRPNDDPEVSIPVLEVLSFCCTEVFTFTGKNSSCVCGYTVIQNDEGWSSSVVCTTPNASVWGTWIKFWFGLDNATVELSYE